MSHHRSVLLAGIVISLLPALAYAHAAYKDSDPKDDASVAAPPSSVWAEYTEPLQEHSTLEVYDPCGTRVDDGATSVTAYRMQVAMSADTAGDYTVRWVAASAVDPHVTRGSFNFSVAEGDTCDVAAAPDSEPDDDDDATSARRTRTSGSTDAAETTTGTTTRPARARDSGQNPAGRVDPPARTSDGSTEDDDGFIAAQGTDNEDAGGIWDGIPLDGFAIALAIAAAIGAAGGRIYANIMGPRR